MDDRRSVVFLFKRLSRLVPFYFLVSYKAKKLFWSIFKENSFLIKKRNRFRKSDSSRYRWLGNCRFFFKYFYINIFSNICDSPLVIPRDILHISELILCQTTIQSISPFLRLKKVVKVCYCFREQFHGRKLDAKISLVAEVNNRHASVEL